MVGPGQRQRRAGAHWVLVIGPQRLFLRCPLSPHLWSSKIMVLCFPLLCTGQEESPKPADPDPKDWSTQLLLQVSAASLAGQERHLVPDLETSDSSLPTHRGDVLSLAHYPQVTFLVLLLKVPTAFPQ